MINKNPPLLAEDLHSKSTKTKTNIFIALYIDTTSYDAIKSFNFSKFLFCSEENIRPMALARNLNVNRDLNPAFFLVSISQLFAFYSAKIFFPLYNGLFIQMRFIRFAVTIVFLVIANRIYLGILSDFLQKIPERLNKGWPRYFSFILVHFLGIYKQ